MKKLFAMLLTACAVGLSGGSWADDTPSVSEPAVVSEAVAVEMAVPAAEAPAAEAAAPAVEVNKGDVSWMMTSTLLVLFMALPGLALFYGGLVRSKNMLSVLMQVMVVFSLISVLWAVYGYSLAFGGEGAIIGGLDKLFLKGVTIDSLADTFTDTVKLPEYIFIAFQCTFAGITCALIVGSFAERIKFSAVLLFSVIWFHLLLPADRAHGVGRRWLPARQGRARLRGRHGCAYQRRCGWSGRRDGARQAYRLR